MRCDERVNSDRERPPPPGMALDWPRPVPQHFTWPQHGDDDASRDAAADAVAAVVDDVTARRATTATGTASAGDAIILASTRDNTFTDPGWDGQLIADVINDVIAQRFPHVIPDASDVDLVTWIATAAWVVLHAAGLPTDRDRLTVIVGDAVHTHQKGATP